MRDQRTPLIVYLLIPFACGLLALMIHLSTRATSTNGYREQDINMLQPNSVIPQVNNLNADTNEMNAHANQMNKEGEAALFLAYAEATQMAVENCATLNNCFAPTGTVAVQGSTMLYLFGAIFVAGGIGMLWLLGKITGNRHNEIVRYEE